MATRELEIKYGTYTVGGSSANRLDGDYTIDRNADRASVEFSYILTASTEALFATGVAAAEAAFREVRENVQVKLGSNFLLGPLKQSDHTGLDSRASIVKADDLADTSRSRRYTVRIEIDLPGTVYETVGLRSSTIAVSKSPAGIATVTISGQFSAIGAKTAREQYEDQIDVYVTDVLDGLGLAFDPEKIEEPSSDSNFSDSVLNFTRVYKEIAYPQTGTLDDPQIANQSLTFTVDTIPDKPKSITINYSAWVTEDIDLPTKWNNKIRPWLLVSSADFSGGTVTTKNESVAFDVMERKITATLTTDVADTNSGILQQKIEVRDQLDSGRIFKGVWDGDPYSGYEFQGKGQVIRQIQETLRFIGLAKLKEPPFNRSVIELGIPRPDGSFAGRPSSTQTAPASASKAFWISSDEGRQPFTVIPQGAQAGTDLPTEVFDYVRTTRIRLYKQAKAPVAGGGGTI